MRCSRPFNALDMRFWPLFFLTLTLLSLFPAKKREFISLTDGHGPSLNSYLPCPESKPLLCSYLFGKKSAVPKRLMKVHREMNLLHLMTPSGLHLGSLLLLYGIFLKVLKRRFNNLPHSKSLPLYILSILTFPLTGVDSFKRMIIFGILRDQTLFPLKTKATFFITFLLAILIGQLSKNPLSFCFSFLFLGILLFSPNRLFSFIYLLLAQAFIGEWMGNAFSPLSAFIGLLLSFLSPFLLILFIIEYFFNFLPFSEMWGILLFWIHNILSFKLPLIFLISVPALYFLGKPRLFRWAITLVILLTPTLLNPNLKGVAYPALPPKGFINKKEVKGKVVLHYENQMKCWGKLLGDSWRTHCYK